MGGETQVRRCHFTHALLLESPWSLLVVNCGVALPLITMDHKAVLMFLGPCTPFNGPRRAMLIQLVSLPQTLLKLRGWSIRDWERYKKLCSLEGEKIVIRVLEFGL